MTWLDRLLLRVLMVVATGWLVAHWTPQPIIKLVTPTQTVVHREVYAGLPPLNDRRMPRR